jgi:poly(A) polymerase
MVSPSPTAAEPGGDLPVGISTVIDEVAPLAARFVGAGHRIHLVGGTVRDLFVAARTGVDLTDGPAWAALDLDLTTSARPADTKRCLEGWADAIWTQGERFGTIGARRRYIHPRTGEPVDRIYEITTHRAEHYDPTSRKPSVAFADHVEADLSRRDFTVNSMAVELGETPVLVDPFGGLADLGAGVLRTPLAPEVSFSDDPLRMLRAARFIARLGLVPTTELLAAVDSLHHRLSIVSVERIRDELFRLLGGPSPAAGVRFLLDHQLLATALPETAAAAAAHPTRWAAVLERLDAVHTTRPMVARLAALLDPAPDPRRRLRSLRCSADEERALAQTLDLARTLATIGRPTPPQLRRALRGRVSMLEDADATAMVLGMDDGIADVRAAIDALVASESLDDLGPGLDGATVMEVLGIGPGPAVGEALAHLTTIRLDEGPLPIEELKFRLRERHGR